MLTRAERLPLTLLLMVHLALQHELKKVRHEGRNDMPLNGFDDVRHYYETENTTFPVSFPPSIVDISYLDLQWGDSEAKQVETNDKEKFPEFRHYNKWKNYFTYLSSNKTSRDIMEMVTQDMARPKFRLNKYWLKHDKKVFISSRPSLNSRRSRPYPSSSFVAVNPNLLKVRKRIVRLHNVLRSRVTPQAADMLAVSWLLPAAKLAQKWADKCNMGRQLESSSERWTSTYGSCGQNVAIYFQKKRWGQVLRNWWAKRRHFRYGDLYNNITLVGAYTQMAWYNSHKVGCGYAQCFSPDGHAFHRYVCNYCPAGNDPTRLKHPYTRGQPCGKCNSSCQSLCHQNRCKLCTNSCSYADLWLNCPALMQQWKEWLCNTKTLQGVERFRNCRATCQCSDRIT